MPAPSRRTSPTDMLIVACALASLLGAGVSTYCLYETWHAADDARKFQATIKSAVKFRELDKSLRKLSEDIPRIGKARNDAP